MTIAIADFRAIFPEFASTNTYPDASVTFWITQAYNQINAGYFGDSMDLAVMLFVAHNVVLSAKEAKAAVRGLPGDAAGPVTSKSVGGVSKSMNSGATVINGAGFWNGTSYGQRFYRLLQTAATGPAFVPGRDVLNVIGFLPGQPGSPYGLPFGGLGYPYN